MFKSLTTIFYLFLCLNMYAQRPSDFLEGDGALDMDQVRPPQLGPILDNNALADGPVKLNSYFEADDGSIVSIRQIDDNVYAIADRMDRRFASIWIGKVKGNVLSLKYYYIPKGQAKGEGILNFKVSGMGRSQRLSLDTSNRLNSPNFNFKSLTTLTRLPDRLPVDERAWYRGDKLNNLTGRWTIPNVGQEYYLDKGKQVFIYSIGGRKSPNSRPQFTSLFVGERSGNILKGFYVDLPLGHTLCGGSAQLDIIGPHQIRTNYNSFYYGVKRDRVREDKKEILN